jgi:hypothetical protein
MADPSATQAARRMTLALLAARASAATLCPSEVARALASPAGDWRSIMPSVHAAIDALVGDGLIQLSWKGERLAARAGPYRIARSRS